MFFYRLLTHLFLPIYLLFACIWVLLGRIKLSSLLQRLGFLFPKNIPLNPIWVQAVSAGEVAAVSALILYLQQQQSIPVVLTTTTASGFAMAKKRLGEQQSVIYFPFDLPLVVQNFYKKINPSMVIVVEMELWPELFAQAKKKACPLFVINGRMPLKDYQRYGYFRKTMQRMFSALSCVFAQSEEDGLRYASIGLDKVKIEILPNLKYYQEIFPSELAPNRGESLFSDFVDKPVVVIGSSHPEEESFLMEVIEQSKILAGGHVIWAPRDIGRSDKLQRKLQARGYRVARRSKNESNNAQILILDSYGELIEAYKVANLVLLGGSWSKKVQGHNPLEATALGKPVVFGSCMNNFFNIAKDLINDKAALQSDSVLETANQVSDIVSDHLLQKKMGQAGVKLVKSQQVEVQKYRDFIVKSYNEIKR